MPSSSRYHLPLKSLGYPRSLHFSPSNFEEFQTLVIWLEDTKIRALAVDDRAPLRRVNSSRSEWMRAFIDYLDECAFPIPLDRSKDISDYIMYEVVEFLINCAIGLEYRDNAARYNNIAETSVVNSGEIISIRPSIDGSSDQALRTAVEQLCQILSIPSEGIDTPALLQTCHNVLDMRQSVDIVSDVDNNTIVDINDFPLGFDTGDPLLNKACTVLRLLYHWDLRRVQDRVNSLIQDLQAFTANPKTDTKLGKVGR